MKKKVFVKTLIDFGKIVGKIAICIGGFLIAEYLLVILPIWFMEIFGLTEKYMDCNAGNIYLVELIVFGIIGLVVWGFRYLYHKNLKEEIESKGDIEC